MLSFSNKLRASRVFLKLQLMHLALSGSLILRRKVPRRRITTALVENRIQTALLMGNISFLEDLAIKSSVRSREIIHVSQRLIELCLIYFGQPAQLVLRET